MTDVKLSHLNAIHFRWLDPLTQQIKETIALVAPSETAVGICSFVGLAARAPNQLVMFATAAQPGAGGAAAALGSSSKPKLDFVPGKSALDRLRHKAVYVPGAVPSTSTLGRSAHALGQDLLAGLGLGGGQDNGAAEGEEGEEGEEGAAGKK